MLANSNRVHEVLNPKPTLAVLFFKQPIFMNWQYRYPTHSAYWVPFIIAATYNMQDMMMSIINGVKHEFLWSLVEAPFCSILYEAALQQWEQNNYTTGCCVSVDNTHRYLPSIHALITPSLNTTNCSWLRKTCMVQHWVAKKIT